MKQLYLTELREPGRLEVDYKSLIEHLNVCGAPAVNSAQLWGSKPQLLYAEMMEAHLCLLPPGSVPSRCPCTFPS